MSTPNHRRVALITGSAQGIGRAIALRLADDGFDVAVNDLATQTANLTSLATEIRDKGRKSIVVTADVSVEEDVDRMVQTTVSELGGLDVMVANAGVAVVTPILETTSEEYNKVFLINVKGVLLCYKAAAKVMIEQKRGGRIIGASSVAGKKGDALYGVYSASKFSVRGLSQVAAREWGKHNITVNTYAPGFIDTPLLRGLEERVGILTRSKVGAYLRALTRQTALRRLGKPEDVARLVSFLASPDGAYITGQSLTVDGGMFFD